MPTFVKASEVRYPTRRREDNQDAQRERAEDPNLLRPLPGEDIFFYSKLIDNSRVVRQPDPRSRGACVSAAGVMCVLAATLTISLAPRIANLFAGYRLESLRQERQGLIDERQMLDVEEAKVLRLDRLEEVARQRNLVPPKSGQLYELEPNGDGSMASLGAKKSQ